MKTRTSAQEIYMTREEVLEALEQSEEYSAEAETITEAIFGPSQGGAQPNADVLPSDPGADPTKS